jgi:hypothetical protein
MSENEELWGPKQAAFQPATKDGPFDVSTHPDEADWAAMHEHVAHKRCGTCVNNQSLSAHLTCAPLDIGEIRILELKRGNFEAPLNGSLVVANIDFAYAVVNHNFKRTTNHAISLSEIEPVWYTALSYTWGAPIFDTKFHFANGTSINITSSLASALKHLCSPTDSILLWIDQICIDQRNVLEKQKQIPLMGLIYSHATNTVIWLGDEGGDDPQLAFDILQEVHIKLACFDGEIKSDDFEQLGFPALTAPDWAEVKKIFSRSWFGRLWVIQEAVLSRNLYVKCGKSVVGWDDFSLWCVTMDACGFRTLIEGDAPVAKARSGLSTIQELLTFRTYVQSQDTPSSLLEALVMTRYATASVAKDKVYGVLGIASPTSSRTGPSEVTSASIQPRYAEEVSVRDVFLEAGIAEFPIELFRFLS